MAARIVLRLALSTATSGAVSAGSWRFRRSCEGKPSVEGALPPISFSVSHCASAVVVAVTRGYSVGVDVESIDEEVSLHAKRAFMSAGEFSATRRLSGARQSRETVRLWTLKEALFKSGTATDDFRNLDFSSSTNSAQGYGATHCDSLYLPLAGTLCIVSLAVGSNSSRPPSGSIQMIDVLGGRNMAPANA